MSTPGSIRRILLVFDDKERPETTGAYFARAFQRLLALGDLDEARHVRPDEIGQLAGSAFDLVIVVDDGLDYPLPVGLGPVVYLAIDTHIDFLRSLARSRQADFVFAAQKDGAERLRQAGIATARWLPLACDPEIHGKQDVPKERDLCFVGNLFPGPRTDLVRLLQQYFPGMYVGNAYFQEMARIYCASKIVFNRSVGNDVNMRVFEALAGGSLLVTNDLADNGQHELFRDGVHLVTYNSGDELLDKVRFYLPRDELRERIAAAGHALVLAKHTYSHRVAELLRTVAASPTRGASEATDLTEESDAIANCELQNANCVSSEGLRLPTSDFRPPIAQCLTPNAHHDPSYFGCARADIVGLVPTDARTICDVGCGHGLTGAMLKERQPCEVRGIELDPDAAAIARTHIDQVHTGDLEQMALPPCDDHFDVVIMGDVIEHLADPPGQLARVRRWIKAGGTLIASIPNVRHHGVVAGLLAGNLTYEPAGLLDVTHRHFFCRRDIQKLFEQAGYTIASWTAVPGPGYDEWQRAGRPAKVTIGNFHLDMPVEETQEFFVYQWLVVAKPAKVTGEREQGSDAIAKCELQNANCKLSEDSRLPTSDFPPPIAQRLTPQSLPPCVSLMVTFNRLEYTKPSLESLLAQDYPNLRIVVWDNASTDGTQDYLRERLQGEPRATLVLSPVNRGVVYPMNEVWFGDLASRPASQVPRCQPLVVLHKSQVVHRPVHGASREAVIDPAFMPWNAGADYCVFSPVHGAYQSSGLSHSGSPVNGAGKKPSFAVCEPGVNAGPNTAAPKPHKWGKSASQPPGSDPPELLAKFDNDTIAPPELLRRLAECHQKSTRFGALAGFHFRAEGEALVDNGMVEVIDGVRVVRQRYVGGCAVMVKKSDLDRIGPITCRAQPAGANTAQPGPFMDSGWTFYQERMAAAGLVHGYPMPLIHVEHLEDTRSPHCIRSAEHQAYKQALRGMTLEQSTEALCVWRPHRLAEVTGDRQQVTGDGEQECDAIANGKLQNAKCKLPEDLRPPTSDLRPRNAQRLCFSQDFRRDFDQFDFFGPAFAFARFGDGERAICAGAAVEAQDGWLYRGGPSQFAADLNAALRFNDPGYYLGLSDACCDRASHDWYLRQITVPLSQVTFANIFVNGNYRRFLGGLDLDRFTVVAPEGGDFWVPEKVLETSFSLDKLVERLLSVKRPILVSAGPAACIIVHKYWCRAAPEHRQVIVDVGSAIDELTKGHKTRQYQVAGTRNAELVCTW